MCRELKLRIFFPKNSSKLPLCAWVAAAGIRLLFLANTARSFATTWPVLTIEYTVPKEKADFIFRDVGVSNFLKILKGLEPNLNAKPCQI